MTQTSAPSFPAVPWLDALCTLLLWCDPQGQVLGANQAFLVATGVGSRSALKPHVADWFLDPAPIEEGLDDLSRQRFDVVRCEAQLRRPGTHESVQVLLCMSRWEGPGGVLLELAEMDQQARQDREERVATQLAANKELTRNLAHEIKNPLGGLRGAAQLLEMELPSAHLREYTQVIIHEADRLQALVDRLLAPHRMAPKWAEVNVHEVLERVRAVVMAEHGQWLHVQRDYDISLPEVRGDREQMIQVFLNIVQNAALALKPAGACASGQPMIRLKSRAARQVTIGKQRHRLALELHVIDNGPGIPPGLLERIFYPLVSGRDGGTGLGLTLAQSLVKQHGGTIEVHSEPGCTDFRILLPLDGSPQSPGEGAAAH